MAVIRGFSWSAAGSIHVVYQTEDGEIHELSSSSPGAWLHANLTALTGTSGAGSVLRAAYEWPPGGSQQIVYTQAPDMQPGSFDQHVHELYRVKGGSWHHADLTTISGAPPAHEGVVAAYAGGAKQVVHKSANGHLHELRVKKGGAWKHTDVTSSTTLVSDFAKHEGLTEAKVQVPSGLAFAGYEYLQNSAWTQRSVWYVNGGLAHRLMHSVDDGTGWTYAPWIPGTQPLDVHQPQHEQVYALQRRSDDSVFTIFLTPGRHIHAFWAQAPWGPPAWKEYIVTEGGPVLIDLNFRLAVFEWFAAETINIVYIGVGGHIHECSIRRVGPFPPSNPEDDPNEVKHVDLTALSGAPAPTLSAAAQVEAFASKKTGTKYIVYPGNDGHIHMLSGKQRGILKHDDLTALTDSPPLWG
jgi:hypothetical protein